jgi:hypothetical protein
MLPISVKIEPQEIEIKQIHSSQQSATYVLKTAKFTATVENDPANNGVVWAIAQGGGAIDERGEFFPPREGLPGVVSKSIISATSVTDKSKLGLATVKYSNASS